MKFRTTVPRSRLFGAKLMLPNGSFLHLGEYEIVASQGEMLEVEVSLNNPDAIEYARHTQNPLLAKWLELFCPFVFQKAMGKVPTQQRRRKKQNGGPR